MPTPVKMPRLGESVAEGTVGAWLKQEGDWVERDESLAEIVTDKINAELPSPVAGRLAKILVQADEMVPVGTDIALIEENADVSASPPPEPAPGPDAAPLKSPAQATRPVMEADLHPFGGRRATIKAHPTTPHHPRPYGKEISPA
jgi:pyruvate/2-oxoglutarate dehydrogenase complex dihydrolipoamide acyltransferase (E2) component